MTTPSVSMPRFTPVTVPPSPPDLGLVRRIWRILRNPLQAVPAPLFEDKVHLIGRGPGQVLMVADPAIAERVLVDDWLAFPKSALVQKTIGEAVGTRSIFTAGPEDWRWQRRAAAPAFRHDRLLGFVPDMARCAQECVEALLEQGGTPDMAHAMMATTLNIIADTMLSGREGLDTPLIDADLSAFFASAPWITARMILRLPDSMPYPGRARARQAVQRLRAIMARITAERRKNGAPRQDLLALMMAAHDPDSGRAMGDEELIDNLLTFVVAGHETTANALTWALWLLANDPAATERLVNEVKAVCGGGAIGAEHVEGLVFTKQVVQEAMRLFPPAPVIPRYAAEACELGGLSIPANTAVFISVYAIHRHKNLWEHPQAFDPDRFAPEKAKALPRGAYLPFGAGPRICIGAAFATIEAVVVLASLMRALRFEPIPGKVPMPHASITLRPKGGLPLRVSARL